MADVKWIKITTDIFDNRKIRQIETLPDGDTIIVIWFKLLCLSGTINDKGYVYLTKEIPYTEEMLATQFNRPLKTIQLALKTFEQFGMVEVIDNILCISNWERYQNIEGMEKIREQNRLRKQKQREKEKLLESHEMSRDGHATDKNRIDKNRIEKNIAVVIRKYEEEIGLVTPTTATLLESYLDDLPEDMILKAIEIASMNNKKNMSYIKGILNSWISKGYKVLADIQNEQKNSNKKESQEEMWKHLKEKYGEGDYIDES